MNARTFWRHVARGVVGLCPSNTPDHRRPDSAHWCALPAAHAVPLHQSKDGYVWTDEDAAERNPAVSAADLLNVPLVVSRYEVAMEPAPEEDQVLTVGAVAEDGRPVALLFDPETRAKVAAWLAPGDADELERLRTFASATGRRHNEIRARLAMVDIRDSAEAWDLGMAIIATLDGPLHPSEGAAPPIATRFRARVYDVLNEAAKTDACPALKFAQVRQYLTEIIACGLLEHDGTASNAPSRATSDAPGEET